MPIPIDLNRLKELEKSSLALDPDAKNRALIRAPFKDYTENFIERLPESKAFDQTDYNVFELIKKPFGEGPLAINEIIEELSKNVDSRGINPASGGHLGYIPGGGVYSAAVGDYLAAIFNRYAGVYFSSPGAVEMEEMLIQWSASVIGFTEKCVGNLTSGGSIASLIAVASARKGKNITSKNYHKAVVYLTEQTHHALEKAVGIAGMEDCALRHIPVDSDFRMQPSELAAQIKQDKDEGLIPWMVVASAGTTNTGSIDPLETIGEIAKENQLWYHIDAAYGGYFALIEETKKKFAGIEQADSVVLDPHKGLSIPFGLGVILIKDEKAILEAHSGGAHYMQDAADANYLHSPSETSPELSKHFRGLRLWLPLKIHGIKPFRDNLEEKLLLAQYFHQEIAKIDGFEAGPIPDLSVVTFRYLPSNGDPDNFNKKLVDEIHKDGRVFLTSTILNDQFVLRVAIVSFRTHKSTIDLLLEILQEKVALLS